MGATESTLLPPRSPQTRRTSLSHSASHVLQHGRALHRLLNPTSPLSPDPESPFYNTLFDDFMTLNFASARPLATLVELSIENPKEQHAIALVCALRAAVHRLRSAQGLVLLGALVFSHSALTELMRVSPSEDSLCLTLGAGHAESSLQEADRIDLGKSLVARILTAALGVLATPQSTDLAAHIKLCCIELLLIALCDELYSVSHAQQPLSTILDRYPHPAKVIHVLLDSLTDAAHVVNIEKHLNIGCEHISAVQRVIPGNGTAPRLSPSGALFAASTSVANLQVSVNNALSAITSKIALSPLATGIGVFPDAAAEAHIAGFASNHVPSPTSSSSTVRSPRATSGRRLSNSTSSVVSEQSRNGLGKFFSSASDVYRETSRTHSFTDDSAARSPRSPTLSNKSLRTSIHREKGKVHLFSPPKPVHLAEQALSLLVILCGPRPSGQYRQALFDMTDSARLDGEDESSYSFPKLYEALGKWLAHPTAALIGYYLVTGNKRFRTFALARTDPDVLLLPLLASMRRRCVVGAIPADAYIPAAIMLTLTSDKGFCEAIDSIGVPSFFVPYLEDPARIGNERIVLSGMILLICARAVQQSLVMRRKAPDRFLASLLLGIMGNVSGDVTNLHSLAAERLLSLVEFLGRRRRKALMFEYQNENMPKKPPRLGDSPRTQDKASSEDMTIGEEAMASDPIMNSFGNPKLSNLIMDYIGLTFEVVVSILRSRSVVSANRHLVYTLLHRESIVELDHLAKISDQTKALCHMLRRMLDFFVELVEDHKDISSESDAPRIRRSKPLKSSSTGISVERVFHIIEKNARHLRSDTFDGLPEIRFRYEEFELAKVFLRPYAWSIATRSTDMFWDLDNATMPISLAPFRPAG